MTTRNKNEINEIREKRRNDFLTSLRENTGETNKNSDESRCNDKKVKRVNETTDKVSEKVIEAHENLGETLEEKIKPKPKKIRKFKEKPENEKNEIKTIESIYGADISDIWNKLDLNLIPNINRVEKITNHYKGKQVDLSKAIEKINDLYQKNKNNRQAIKFILNDLFEEGFQSLLEIESDFLNVAIRRVITPNKKNGRRQSLKLLYNDLVYYSHKDRRSSYFNELLELIKNGKYCSISFKRGELLEVTNI